ncbi:PREDICTED: uncharacterized protein LOC109372292 isoform X1 [Hipposideros armiger]|uniref:Uncharacterized protein LOC109372292 isoform X1 n=1 Tax=Hipposideros armiger TaxID=186990 RepID=A0A8B7PYZ4_HIPAR|nr:PREDICTED: uncharacterized protein LOC109372292 isoform X1 [Hipposideros armiger]XP_019480901.1 PREDICTED: uncharacterized protein LOC109372292 isoform X1 [Hipposideros armiger]XP_019480902.1 PREDICTED: uncharacterized protein LOC109372292 isoform X1 [Hipposideros armiger]
MGNNTSGIKKDSPLGCILANWKHFKLYSLKKKKLIYFCNVTWPKYSLGEQEEWPQNGSLNGNTIAELYLFCQRSNKSLEIFYVLPFVKLHEDKKHQRSCRVCVASLSKNPDPMAPSASDFKLLDLIFAPPNLVPRAFLDSLPSSHPVSFAEPLPHAPVPNPSAHSAPNPSPPALSSTRTRSGLRRPTETPRRRPPPPPPPPLPPLPPPPPPPPPAPAPADSPSPANGCFLFQEVADRSREIVRAHEPFSVTDMSQCKEILGNFSDDPNRFQDEIFKLSLTSSLTWQDILDILTHCCTQYEKALIWGEAQEYADSLVVTNPQHDVIRLARESIPDQNPQWDYRDRLGRARMEHFITCILEGIKRCQVKQVNYKKIKEITQEKEENPALFLNRLSEAMKKYTNIDPQSVEGRVLLAVHFRTQAAPDIKRKLANLEITPHVPLSTLVKEAIKVFNNRDQAKEAKKKKKLKNKIRPPPQDDCRPRRSAQDKRQGWSGVGWNQCASHKNEGYWKQDCPERHKNRECLDHPRKLGQVSNPNRPSLPANLSQEGTASERGGRIVHPALTLDNSITITPAEPRVSPNVAGMKTGFLLDAGAANSVLTRLVGPLPSRACTVKWIDGKPKVRQSTFPLTCDTGSKTIDHSFLCVPECPVPLIGRDLIMKLGASVFLQEENGHISEPYQGIYSLYLPEDIKAQVRATVWDTSTPGRAINVEPVKIKLKPGAKCPWQCQPPLSAKVLRDMEPLLEKFLKHGLIRPCQSPCNTPVFLVKKRNGEQLFVQDLRAVNKMVIPIHPTIPNSYTLLTQIPRETQYYTVLDLKDPFFCIPLHPDSQYLFAFEWKSPKTCKVTQYTWTVLPQGFRDSSHLFRNALAKELRELKLQNGTLLQYVNNLLIASTNYQDSQHNTIMTLNFLALRGYKVSHSKAQISLQKVRYLQFILTPGAQLLDPDRKRAVTSLPVPTTKKELRRFLGTAEFCRTWIPNFGLIVKPLYAALKGKERKLLWDQICQQAFETLKTKIDLASVLGLPDLRKPFFLYIHEEQGIASGVLTQKLGLSQKPIAYLSKQLDSVAQRWPGCVRAVAATAVLVKEALKLTLGQWLEVFTPHQVQTVLDNGHHCLTETRISKYRALLLHTPDLTLRTCQTLNPETLLPSTEESIPAWRLKTGLI